MLSWIWPADRSRRVLTLLALLFICKQVLMIVIFPPFTGHDEVAHFDYVRTLADEHRIPIIPDIDKWREAIASNEPPPGDYLRADLYRYCYYTLDWPCFPDVAAFRATPPRRDTNDSTGLIYPAGWQYAANHPPLYYTLEAPLYWASNSFGLGVQMRIMRLGALPFGLLAVIATFIIGRQLFPRRPGIAVLAAAFIAFEPQISYEAALVNNDITVIGLGAALVALLLHGLPRRFPIVTAAGCGVLLGLTLLAKGTSVVFAPVVAIAVIGSFGWKAWRDWIPIGGLIAAIGFGMVSPWYLFLYRQYGNLNALPQVSDIQSSWNYIDGAPSFFGLLTDFNFNARLWKESWGGFGWRRIPLEFPILVVIGVVMAICALGMVRFGIRALREWRSPQRSGAVLGIEAWRWWGMAGIVALAVIGYLAVVQFGTSFQLAQARYFFASVPPFAVLLALGWEVMTPARWRRYSAVFFVAFMIGINVYIYSAYVIPYWYTGTPK